MPNIESKAETYKEYINELVQKPLTLSEERFLRDRLREYAQHLCTEKFIAFNDCINNNKLSGGLRCKSLYFDLTECLAAYATEDIFQQYVENYRRTERPKIILDNWLKSEEERREKNTS